MARERMDFELRPETIRRLRTEPSEKQGLTPCRRMCPTCPHQRDVRQQACDIYDLETFCLEEPHICHSTRAGLCRGVTEKLIMNGYQWKTIKEEAQ